MMASNQIFPSQRNCREMKGGDEEQGVKVKVKGDEEQGVKVKDNQDQLDNKDVY